MRMKKFEDWKWYAALAAIGSLLFLPYLFSPDVLLASDQMGSMMWKFYFDTLRDFRIPLWYPYGLGGMPTFDAMWGDASYPPFILMGLLFPVERLVSHMFFLHTLIAGFTAFFLARRFFSLSALASLALGTAYMLNTNFLSHVYPGHTGKFYIMAWLPLSVYFLLRSLENRPRWFHLVGLSLTVCLFLLTSHLQFTYFVLMGYFLYWAYKVWGWIRAAEWRNLALGAGRFWLPILLGIGLAFPIFYPPTQYNKGFSVRGEGERTTYEHAISWSLNPEEMVAMLTVPEFTGLHEYYWGRNPFKLNSEYVGMGLLFLAAFGVSVFRTRWMWFWLGVGGLAVIYALAGHTPIFRLFYEFIPGIRNFRAAGMMIFWLVMALFLIAAETLRLLDREWKAFPQERKGRVARRLLVIGLGAAGLLLLASFAGEAVYSAYNAVMDQTRFKMAQQAAAVKPFQGGALRAALLLALLVLALWKWGLQADTRWRFLLSLFAIAAVDLLLVGSKFVRKYPVEEFVAHEPAVDFLKADTGEFRVFGISGSIRNTGLFPANGVELIYGFTDHENRYFRAYRGEPYHESPNLFNGLAQNPDGTVSGSTFLDLLNVRYLAFRSPEAPGLQLIRNRDPLPRAWFVDDWEVVEDGAVLDRMKDPGFRPRRKALLTEEQAAVVPPPPGPAPDPAAPAAAPAPDSALAAADSALAGSGMDAATAAGPEVRAEVAAISETFRSPNRIRYDVKAPREGLLVLSEIWFPHWKATVDGEEKPVLRTNYIFRSVHLPAGEHKVEFHYDSPWISLGLKVSLASMAALALVAFAFARLDRGGAGSGSARDDAKAQDNGLKNPA